MEQNYRSILKNSGDAVIIADFNARVVTVNPALLQMLGYASTDDLIGKLVMELGPMSGTFTCTTGEMIAIDEQVQAEQRRTADRLFEQGRVSTELYLFRADGAIIPVEATMSLLRDRSGLRRGTVIICRDCTGRRLIEHELRSARDELEIKVQERTRALEEVNTALGCCSRPGKTTGRSWKKNLFP
jgi:PAS domain-containing protein